MVKQRQLDPTGDRDLIMIGGCGVGLLAVAVGLAWTSLHLAAWWTGSAAPAMNPVGLVVDLARQRLQWTSTATTAAVVQVVILFAVMLLAIFLSPKKSSGKRQRSDRSARFMARPADYSHLTETGARSKARELGFPGNGLPLGETLCGKPLFASWEDTAILIAGPRTQKTTAYAIPSILAAPGACIVTGNKRDVFDVTAPLRAQTGHVWLFDPQRVAAGAQEGEPSWFWDPLSYVDGSETRAERLAAQIVTSTRPDGARTDAYFDGEAENLLGLLLLAASLTGDPITAVYTWLTDDKRQQEPVDALLSHGLDLQHAALRALTRLPDKQREGVYGTARAFTGFLRNREIVPWITPAAGYQAWTARRFDPHEFARSSDTLYSLSDEGRAGSVGPLVAALTMAVLDALEEHATRQPQGRLSVPCVAVLDEAANVCKLRDLDSKYSHYGSRGIIPFTILQSWHQGGQVWGDHGMEKLWSAANVSIYGGGVDDDRFLNRLSTLIGHYDRIDRTSSRGRNGHSISKGVQRDTILTAAELRELPAGRAVMFASGTPAMLIHPVQWFRGRDEKRITASLGEANSSREAVA